MLGGKAGCPVPGRTGRREGEHGEHENSLPFVGRVSEQVWLYKEREGGGGKIQGHPI